MEHVVLLKFKAGTAQETIDAAMVAVQALDQTIPCVQHMRCGATCTSERAKGYSHALVATLGGEGDLPHYAKHEAHVALVQQHLKPILDNILAVDIPFTSKPARGPYSAEQMSQSSMVLGAAAALSGFFLGIAFMSARR